jgi:hypothetical protein
VDVRTSWRFVAGLVLTGFALVALLLATFWIRFRGFIDFPCFGYTSDGVQQDIRADTRVVYCISYWPRGFSGGSVYAAGATIDDRVQITATSGFAPRWHGALTLERQGQTLLVNGLPLRPGEEHSWSRRVRTANPWILYTTHFVVINEGPLGPIKTPEGNTIETQAVFAAGDVHESWLPNPLGALILAAGVWLLSHELRKAEREARSKH